MNTMGLGRLITDEYTARIGAKLYCLQHVGVSRDDSHIRFRSSRPSDWYHPKRPIFEFYKLGRFYLNDRNDSKFLYDTSRRP